MKKIKVQIKEKDKGDKNLSLLNLREEVVNFLYKDTIANSTKADMQFFVLLFFVSIKSNNKLVLEQVLDEAIPKFKKLNESFGKKKRFLRAKEYQKLVEENELGELFKNDIFFILIESILNIKEIEKRFSSFIDKNENLKLAIQKIKSKYLTQLTSGIEDFQSSKIEDDRYDENGNYYDLSKSVYTMVRMRNSRNLDLNLQKYTSIKEIISKSPIDLTFFQHINPQIIFDLWDKYHLAEYVHSIASHALTFTRDHFSLNIDLGDLINGWILYKITSGNDRKEKLKNQQIFEQAKIKPENRSSLEDLTTILVKSILNANKRLEAEVERMRQEINELRSQNVELQDKLKIKKLEERLKQLENLSVSAEVVEE